MLEQVATYISCKHKLVHIVTFEILQIAGCRNLAQSDTCSNQQTGFHKQLFTSLQKYIISAIVLLF